MSSRASPFSAIFESLEIKFETIRESIMARGGPRPGAGRKPIPGGKTDRDRAKRQAVKEAVELAKAEGKTPLEYMLDVMRTSGDWRRRDAMAVAAAPYLHARLTAATVRHEHGGLDDLDTSDLIRLLGSADREGAAEEEGGRSETDPVH
jgi:hypothetical protein